MSGQRLVNGNAGQKEKATKKISQQRSSFHQSSVGRFTSSPVLAWLAPECSCVVRILPGRVQLSFDIQIARNYPGKEKASGRGEKRVGCLAQIQVPPSVINMIAWERSRLRLPRPPEGHVVVIVVVISAARR